MTEQEAIQKCKEIYAKEELYIILSSTRANMLSGISVPFVGQPNGKTVIYIFDEYEKAKHFVDEYRFEKLGGNYPIAKIDKTEGVYSLSAIITVAIALGTEHMDYNLMTEDAFGVSLRWFCSVNNVDPQNVAMIVSADYAQKLRTGTEKVKPSFSPMKIMNFVDPFNIDEETKEKDLRLIFDAGETAGDYSETFSRLSMIECLLMLDYVTTKYIPNAAAEKRDDHLKYFVMVEVILQEVVLSKLLKETNLFVATDSETEDVLIRDKTFYVLITDVYKYNASHKLRKIDSIDAIKAIIKMYDVEQMIITDGPRYIGIVPVKKFLESIENTITE